MHAGQYPQPSIMQNKFWICVRVIVFVMIGVLQPLWIFICVVLNEWKLRSMIMKCSWGPAEANLDAPPHWYGALPFSFATRADFLWVCVGLVEGPSKQTFWLASLGSALVRGNYKNCGRSPRSRRGPWILPETDSNQLRTLIPFGDSTVNCPIFAKLRHLALGSYNWPPEGRTDL